jgi:hypothetical protein
MSAAPHPSQRSSLTALSLLAPSHFLNQPIHRFKANTVSKLLPDEVALFLYKDVVVPWKTRLKSKKVSWDKRRVEQALSGSVKTFNML